MKLKTSLAVAALAAAILSLAGCGGDDADTVVVTPPTTPPSSDSRTPLAVTKETDDGSEGTLRAAILKSNASPGTYRIVLTAPVTGTLTIKPTTELPAIVGPARIEGSWTRDAGTVPREAIDGSLLYDLKVLNAAGNPTACPGEADGQFGANVRSLKNAGLRVKDSAQVEFTGFEVRNFCSGIIIHRSKDNHIHRMRFFNNLGASGVVLTGDDGTAAGGATVGLTSGNVVEFNDFLNNSDSMDVARGTENALIQFNSFKIDASGIVPSQGIEVLSSNNIKIYDNTLEGFAEALQIGGNGHDIQRNTIVGNSIAFTMSGTTNVAKANVIHGNHSGILTRGGNITLTQNLIWDNGKDISLANAGGIASTNANWFKSRMGIGLNSTNGPTVNDLASSCADGFADCDTRQNFPVLGASGWQPQGFFVAGSLSSRPNEKFTIEIFANHRGGIDGIGEGEVYLGSLTVTTSATGSVAFTYPTGLLDPLKDGTKNVWFTATATRVSNGQTSEFGAALLVAAP